MKRKRPMLDLTVRHQGTNIELGINMNRKATNEKINCILDTDELLDDSHMPVLMVMNMVKEKRFLAVLEALSKGNGFGENYGACTLPEDLDDFDRANGEELDGAEFALHSGEGVVINFKTLYYYLKILCDKYVKNHIEQAGIVDGLLVDFSNRFL